MSEIAELTERLQPRKTTTELSETARAYMLDALRPNTRRAYAGQLAQWLKWKELSDFEPVDPVELANYLAERHAAGMAVSTLRTIIGAIKAGHDAKGWSFNSTAPALSKVLRGASNKRPRIPRQAEPLQAATLLDVIEGIGRGKRSAIDLRDAALLAVGYVFALRRSELVGLDFNVQGDGDNAGSGFLRLTPKAIEVVFAISKTSTGEPEVVTVPRDENIEAARAIEAWLEAGDIRPGDPLFRRITKGGVVRDRLTPQSVALIIKARMAKHAVSEDGLAKRSAIVDASRYSGHSLRVGFCVTAAEGGADVRSIATVTRHRSLVMPQRYAQRADQLKTSPHRLAGVGLKREGTQS